MSAKEQTRPQDVTTPWYKKPVLPWIIILVMVTAFGFTVLGWTLRGTVADAVDAQAASIAEHMSKPQK